MILHECERCGSLSDDKKGVHAQNRYDDWLIVTARQTKVPDYVGDNIEVCMEICTKCKASFNTWKKNLSGE